MNLETIGGKEVCANCKRYYQHYIKTRSGYAACFCGHCVYPRLKKRKPDDSCEHFEGKGIRIRL